jgi:hypothetical protein
VIYSFPCLNCRPYDVRYYGKTHQLAGERKKQHELSNRKLMESRELSQGLTREAKEKELSSKTAWLEHAIETNHNFDVGAMQIHHHCTSFNKLSILEMLYISDDSKSVNNRRDVANLSSAYSNILRLRKEMNFRK